MSSHGDQSHQAASTILYKIILWVIPRLVAGAKRYINITCSTRRWASCSARWRRRPCLKNNQFFLFFYFWSFWFSIFPIFRLFFVLDIFCFRFVLFSICFTPFRFYISINQINDWTWQTSSKEADIKDIVLAGC